MESRFWTDFFIYSEGTMTEFYKENKNHPNNYELIQVSDLDVASVWALQAMAHSKGKGLIANVDDPISLGFLKDRGFIPIYTTHFTKLNVRDYAGEPVVTVGELEEDLRQELVLLLRDHYERIHRVNPASKKINYRNLIFKTKDFDFEHSVVRLSHEHIIAAILIFKRTDGFHLGWTFGDDVPTLLGLWRDLLGILPVGNVLKAEFQDNDVLTMSVYDTFLWHQTEQVQQTLLWQGHANGLLKN